MESRGRAAARPSSCRRHSGMETIRDRSPGVGLSGGAQRTAARRRGRGRRGGGRGHADLSAVGIDRLLRAPDFVQEEGTSGGDGSGRRAPAAVRDARARAHARGGPPGNSRVALARERGRLRGARARARRGRARSGRITLAAVARRRPSCAVVPGRAAAPEDAAVIVSSARLRTADAVSSTYAAGSARAAALYRYYPDCHASRDFVFFERPDFRPRPAALRHSDPAAGLPF